MILQKYTFFFQADEDHFVAEMPAFAHPGEAVSHWGASVLDEVLERGWKRCRRRLGSPSAPGGSGCPGTGRTLGHPASPTSFHFSLHSKHGNQGRERKLTPTRTCCVPGSGLCALYMSLSLVWYCGSRLWSWSAFKSWLCCFLAGWPWADYLIFLCLDFPICKMGIPIGPSLEVVVRIKWDSKCSLKSAVNIFMLIIATLRSYFLGQVWLSYVHEETQMWWLKYNRTFFFSHDTV